MKGTQQFKKVIEEKLQEMAAADPLFAENLNKENKNINDCINYILSTVQKSGCNGFADEEIFGMAAHYYDEDDITISKSSGKMNVVINRQIELTPEEIQEAKQKAKEIAIAQEKDRLTKKQTPKKVEQAPVSVQQSLF